MSPSVSIGAYTSTCPVSPADLNIGLAKKQVATVQVTPRGLYHFVCKIWKMDSGKILKSKTSAVLWYSTDLRYRADNLILSAMTPGPNEPTSAQLQHCLKIIVDDLLDLYNSGIEINSPEHPNGIVDHYA